MSTPKSRVDYIFMNENMIFFPLCNMTLRKSPNFEDVRMGDHLGLCIDLNTSENLKGCGYWKLNNS